MGAAPIDLSAGLVPKSGTSVDISAGLVPKDQPDTRSLFQKAKDNFNANTQGAQPGDGAVKGFVENIGQGGAQTLRAIAHPIDTLSSMASAAAHPLDTAHAEVDQLRSDPSRFIGNAVGQVGTGAILGGAAEAVISAVPGATSAVGDAASSAHAKLYPKPQSLASDVSAARNLSKALVVDPAGVTNFVKAATDEAGTVVGYAKDNGLPINSKIDFANAAKSAADAVQSHFQQNILGPHATEIAPVPASYHGVTTGEGPNATLGAINDRINAINQELNPNYRKALPSQTNAANVSDADLQAEKSALTNTLHNNLAQATGLQPSDIAGVRQQAGKLRTIADEATLSANRDLTGAGKQDMGATTSAVGTKTGLIDRALQIVQGGPEIIGNRNINTAIQKVQPKSLSLPHPTPVTAPTPAVRVPTGGPSTVISGPDYTPDPNAANVLNSRIAARRPTAPTPAPVTQMQRWANNGAENMKSEGVSADDAATLGSLPSGRQLLIKASSLSPGSPALKNLVIQAQKLISTGEADYR